MASRWGSPAARPDQPGSSDSRRVSTRGPSSVIATVCSEWAVREPSAERSVQPAGSWTIRSVVRANQGSSARVSPGRSTSPRPARPRLDTCGSSCLRRGADFVKVMATGARSVELEDPGPAQLTHDEMAALVEEAHRP